MNYDFAESGANFIVPQINIDEMTQGAGIGFKIKNQLSPINQSIYDKFEDGSNRKSPAR
jgi:hypothetical protein